MKAAIYARVSTGKQELDHQIAACRRLCEYKEYEIAAVYSEIGSGAKSTRPEYLKCLEALRRYDYDAVVVFRLDRLGRNARELSLVIDELESKGIKVISVNESFDTSTALGRAMREIVGVLAALEREQISEATTQRLAALKAAGKRLGQKPCSDFQVNKARELFAAGTGIRAISRQMHIAASTVSNIVHRKGYYSDAPENSEI